MENASEALIMAGQALIFIIALTVCISSFTTIRVSIDNVVDQTETINLAKDTSSTTYINFINSRNNASIRTVGAETVVSSMYRAIKENYVLYIKLVNFNSLPLSLVDDSNIPTDNDNPLKIIHAKKDLYIGSAKKIAKGDKIIKVTIASDATQRSNASLANGLYDIIKGENFLEYLGEWQNDSVANAEDKTVNRIITYIQQ